MSKIDKDEILDKHLGLNAEMGYKPIDRKDIIAAMEEYARKKNQELQLLVNILTPTSKKSLKCDCEEPIPNYPEMVWCNKCGFKIDNTKYCACGEEIESENSSVCIDCFNEMTFND